jgi:ATP-binding protein involved in chromosome partitioning
MFRKVHVPLLGLVENMSCFTCPSCGHSEAIFGEGGGAATAAELGMELLGQVGVSRVQCLKC